MTDSATNKQESINNLYSELGTLIKSESNNDVSSLSSISSSSTSTAHSTSCACKHWLVSIDTRNCSLCDRTIDPIDELQAEKERLEQQVQTLNTQLDERTSLLQSYSKDVHTLENQYNKHKEQVDSTTQCIENLQQDIDFLKTKHKDEIAHTIAIEQSKKGVETELHDLTQKLFEEANALVLAEKQKKLALQKDHDQVKLQLENAKEELIAVQAELNALRDKMTNEPAEAGVKTTHENYTLRAQLDMATLLNVPQPVEINPTQKDSLLLDEFQVFLSSLKSTSLSRSNQLPFMKHCLKVDIEPCLRFNRPPVRKLLDAILSKSCLVEECPAEFIELKKKAPQMKSKTRIWGFSSQSYHSNTHNSLLSCYTCGKELEEGEDEMWRFRTSYFDEWSLIDRYCRDRISSVICFYNWLRRLKDEKDETDLESVYDEYTRLQLQMLLSRMGMLPTLLGSLGSKEGKEEKEEKS